jgi:hypothetical protein
MKRDAYYAPVCCIAVILAVPAAAQPMAQTPTPAVQAPAPTAPTPSPAIQPATVNQAGNSEQATDQSSKSTAPRQKTCEAVLIRAGPNQGQIINKCHRSER